MTSTMKNTNTTGTTIKDMDVTSLITRYINMLKSEEASTIPTKGVISMLESVLDDVVFKTQYNKRNTELECLIKNLKEHGVR
jgi:hypothetical protein